MKKHTTLFAGALIGLWVLLIYLPARHMYLMGDDFEILNAVYAGWSHPSVLLHPLNNFFRPLVKLSFLLNFTLFGTQALSYVLLTLFHHILNVILLYAVFVRMTNNIRIAGAISLLFGTSPLYSEVPLWSSCRSDAIGLSCWLGSLLFLSHPQFRRRRNYQLAVLLLMGISACAKENWIIFPFLSILFLVLVQREPWKDALRCHRWVLVLLGGYGISALLLPYLKGTRAITGYAPTTVSAMVTKCAFLLYRYFGFGDWFVNESWQIAALLGVLGGLVVLLALSKNTLALWGFVWMMAAMLPTLPMKYAATRFNYLPLAGFWIMIVMGACQLGRYLERTYSLRPLYSFIICAGCTLYITAYQSIMLQWEIKDYTAHGRAHQKVAQMYQASQARMPIQFPVLFVNNGKRHPIAELGASYQGYPKLLYSRDDGMWQLIHFAPLANFLGDPFHGKVRPVSPSDIPSILEQDFQVLEFTDNGFRLTDHHTQAIRTYFSTRGHLPAAIQAYEYVVSPL